jgi:peptide deformylase
MLCVTMYAGRVERSKWIEVHYQDVTGAKQKKRFEDFEAQVFQHEYDHLDKVCTFGYISISHLKVFLHLVVIVLDDGLEWCIC